MILIVMICTAILTSLSFAGALRYRTYRDEQEDKLKDLEKRIPQPSRDLPTLNARFIHEQEHELHPDFDFSNTHINCRVCGPGPLRRNEVPSIYDHTFRGDVTYADDYGFSYETVGYVSDPEKADVVTSQIEGTPFHSFMVDVDLPARLLPSSTPGCSHLYIDRPMTWRTYKHVLRALNRAGIIEDGYYKAARKQNATHLRVPWKDKPLP